MLKEKRKELKLKQYASIMDKPPSEQNSDISPTQSKGQSRSRIEEAMESPLPSALSRLK